MPKQTIKVLTLKVMINREYTRDENLYNVYTNAGNGRNADYYAARLVLRVKHDQYTKP